ncbi:MAG: hypothetical protein KJ065_09250 [Anaerolineae bacterium]|nr:hypothetical protein [Anaerolineae bacterium]
MFIRQLYRILFRQHRRSRLPRFVRGFHREYEAIDIDDADMQVALGSGRFRDPWHVVGMLHKYGAADVYELLEMLPKRKGVNWRRRFRRWLLYVEGSEVSDPFRREWQSIKNGERRLW